MNRLEEFVETYKVEREGVPLITAIDLADLKSTGYSAADLLNYIANRHNLLLHGSRENISEYLKPNQENNILASCSANAAIMKAIISNRGLRGPGLEYPYFIDDENPFIVKISGMNKDTINERGFVYVIAGKDRRRFENEPKGSWQYIKKDSPVPFVAKIEVLRDDLIMPVFDTDNHEWIQ